MAVKEDAYKDIEYESLPEQFPNTTTRRRRWQLNWSFGSFAIGGSIASLLVTVGFCIVMAVNRPKTAKELESQDWNNCGRTSKVAIERGCVMDPALYAWMPPQCYYDELSSSLPPILENRQYYSDENMTQPIRAEQLYRGEFPRIYTMRYHDEHCLFQWRKLQYAIEHNKLLVDSLTVDYGHSKHCADALAAGREPQSGKGQEIFLDFHHCRKTWGL